MNYISKMNPKKRIILISGKQGAGKTTLADRLVKELQAVVFKFADPLYAMHDKCLPVLKEFGIRPWEMKKDGELLQVLGTEYGRNKLGDQVWVRSCRTRILKWLDKQSNSFCVIDDARFENEFDAFPDAITVRLEAPEELRKARCSYWRQQTDHPSEIGLDLYASTPTKFDLVLDTGKLSPDEVYKQVSYCIFMNNVGDE